MPILRCVETPDRLTEPSYDPAGEPPAALRRIGGSLWGLGEQVTWVAGLVLALSALTGWYSGSGEGVDVSVIGWNTGVDRQARLLHRPGCDSRRRAPLLGGRAPGRSAREPRRHLTRSALDDPRARSDDLDPDDFFFAGRGVGIWISLAASVALIGAGLLQASEEL